MTLIRIILLVLVGYMARRLYLGVKSVGRSNGRQSPVGSNSNPGPQSKAEVKDLTDQDIDDAEFEEIP